MASFIHPENQQLLWNILHSNSTLMESFSTQSTQQKDEWFKSAIAVFYKKVGDTPLNKTQLHQINKDALAYMIQSIHRTQYAVQQEQQQILLKKPPDVLPDPVAYQLYKENAATAHMQADFSSVKREEMFSRQFQEKEREYKSMLDVRAPEAIDFREKIEDTAISNMDELIKKHQMEREKELQIYRPASIAPEQVVVAASATDVARATEGPSENIVFRPVELESGPASGPASGPTGEASAKTFFQEKENGDLKKRLQEISETISMLTNELENIKKLLE